MSTLPPLSPPRLSLRKASAPLVLGLAALLPLCAALPAQAQSWILDPTQSSQDIHQTGYTLNWNNWSKPIITDQDGWAGGLEFEMRGPCSTATDALTMHGFATVEIKQSSVYVWASGTDSTGKPIPAPNPPAKAYFRLGGSAGSYVYAKGSDAAMLDAASSLSCTGDDGLGDAPVLTTEKDDSYPCMIYMRGGSEGIHLVQKDGSSGTVTFSFNPSAHAEGRLSSTQTGDRNPYAPPPSFYGDGEANLIPVDVEPAAPPTAMITSSVDTSYHKGADGKPQPNLPSADGSDVTGDSAAGWSSINNCWEGDVGFVDNTSGFTDPTYSWTPGGSLIRQVDTGAYQISCPFSLGADRSATSLSSTTTSCDVSDSSGATATGTYTIQWHLPVENWALVSSGWYPNEMCSEPGKDPDDNETIGANRTVHFTISPPHADWDWGLTGSIFLGAGAGALPIYADAIGLSNPATAITVGLLTAASIAAGSAHAPDPEHDTRQADYAEYVADVKHQLEINATPPESNIELDRLDPPSEAQPAWDEIQRLQNAYGADWMSRWDQDRYFNAAPVAYATAQAGRYRTMLTFTGDAYGAHGYVGPQPGTIIKPKDIFYAFLWHIN